MFPAQALAEALIERGWQVTLSTDARGARYAAGFPAQVTISEIPAATFARGGLAEKLIAPFRIMAGIAAALIAFTRTRPAIVIGFGGYPSLPALTAATLLRLPRMIHEQNGIPGRVNRRFATRVNAVACGTWPTTLPEGTNAEHTGNPVRAAILARAGAAYIPPGDYPISLLVIGGSQGARILADTVPAALAALPETLRKNLRVAQQARAEDIARTRAAYDAADIPAEVEPFFTDIPDRLANAQLVISRAGASSLADISVIGRPAILIPYAAAADDHQTANARPLVEANAALMIPEADFTPAQLASTLQSLLTDPPRALKMSLAALHSARPDATDRLLALAEALATPETAP